MENLLKKFLLSSRVAGMLVAGMLVAGCSGEETETITTISQDSSSTSVSKSLTKPDQVKTVDANDPHLVGNEYEEKYPNGVIRIKGYVLNGMREGQWFSFYQNAKPWSQNFYKKGRLNGPTATWYENGQMRYSGEYEQDQRIGNWTFWDEQGKKIEEINYDKEGEK